METPLQPDDAQARAARIEELQSALLAGSGISRSPDKRGQKFDACLESGEFKSSGLDAVASSLRANTRRLLAYSSLPLAAFNYGRRFQEAYTRVAIDHGRDPNAPHYMIINEEEDAEFFLAVEVALRKWIIGKADQPSTIGSVSNLSHVAGLAAVDWDRNQEAIKGFYGSVVIHAWTVFESLSEDLWVAALNAHPKRLALLSGKYRSKFWPSKRWCGGLRQEPSRGKAQERELNLSLNELQRHSFELKSRMGAILKGRFSFAALDGIREAYFQAFSKQSDGIAAILDDDGLQYAAAVRNLLIHKSGIVDQEFLNQTALLPAVPRIEIEHPFPLTGTICAELADSCRCCAVWLVMAVHDWIASHPESQAGGSDHGE